jgi:subtilase family serine protease
MTTTHGLRSVRGLAIMATVAATACASAVGSAGASADLSSHRTSSTTHRISPDFDITPHAVWAGRPQPGGKVLFDCQTPAPGGIQCYGPDQIRVAYGIQPLLQHGITGVGRTIVIVDAFSPPDVRSELAAFDKAWGLGTADLRIVAPQGKTPWNANDPDQLGWSGEIALDVEWAHVVAPKAKIVLVEARSDADNAILAAVKFAVTHGLGDVISQSFGEDERCLLTSNRREYHEVNRLATQKDITMVASSGDFGSAQSTCDFSGVSQAVSYPASDPLTLGVGGTQLFANGRTGQYHSERVWNESKTFGAAGGGGFSRIFERPTYQRGVVEPDRRGVPDVAYSAAIDGGVLVYWGAGGTSDAGFYIFGGTSAGSPQWAGLIALSDQLAKQRVGFVNPAIYRAGTSGNYHDLFHDITNGNNAFSFQNAQGQWVKIPGYSAKPGWDAATGWGTPKAMNLVPYLARVVD